MLFFLLMLVIPTTYQLERGALLAIILAGCVVHVFRNGWLLNKKIFAWGIVTISSSVLFIAIGLVNSTPGAFRVIPVYVLWPILFLFFTGVVNSSDKLLAFIKVIIIASLIVASMAMVLVMDNLFDVNLGVDAFLQTQDAGIGLYDGYIEYRLFNMTTAIYALPFLLGLLLTPEPWSPIRGRWKSATWIALVLCALTLLVSGRRGFWIISALSPFVAWILIKSANMRMSLLKLIFKIAVAGFIMAGLVVPILNIDLTSVWRNILDGFDFMDVDNLSASSRYDQFFVLISEWVKAPLLGAGHGASAAGVIRSYEQPWAYELVYVALLFQVGILGILVYGSAILWIFLKGVALMRRQPESAGLLIPTLTGLACFLVASATNPYLQKFDYLWTIFLPVAVLNSYMLRKKND